MKKILNQFCLQLCLIIAVATLAPHANAASSSHKGWGTGGPFGLGIVLGDPTAITGRYNLDQVRAIDGGLAFFYNNWTLLYFDGLYQFQNAFGRNNAFVAQTTPYIGIGGVMVFSSSSRNDHYFADSNANFALGVRIPFGAEWRAATAPVGIFLEIAPGIAIIPGTWSFIHAGIGARFYF